MKKNLLMTLFLTTSIASCFAATIAEREKVIEGFKNDTGKAIEAINKQQQDGNIKTDEQHYIVVLEKITDKKYSRVAHYKKENVGKDIEDSLLNVVEEAERKLNDSNSDGPVSFNFKADNKDAFAVVSRFGKYIVFNISNDKKEVDAACGIKADQQKPKEEDKPIQEAPKVVEKTTEAVQEQESPAKEAPKTEKGAASENPPADDNSAKKDSGTTQDKGAN